MKKIYLIALTCIMSESAFSQSTYYSHRTVDAKVSVTHTYEEDKWAYLERMTNLANSNYEASLNSVAENMHNLNEVELVNKYNIPRLEQFKKQVKTRLETYSEYYCQPQNIAQANKLINSYLTDKPLRDEIKALSALFGEIRTLKSINPENFSNSARYKELMSVLDELTNCSNNDIALIARKHGIL